MTILMVEDEKELDVKRFYLPIKVSNNCPECGATHTHDFAKHYLNYPIINQCEPVYECCSNCDHEYYFKVTLKVGLEIEEESPELIPGTNEALDKLKIRK